ncbi:class I SAM-dependent methyltransferase [Luminiphilus sp. nBUS_07]|uniref:class I SAM-dependent methyltransferase n=1 Tax=Luminiphilus sp. nBUS_07 TaxID=3395314 RepID=UPI003EBC2A55
MLLLFKKIFIKAIHVPRWTVRKIINLIRWVLIKTIDLPRLFWAACYWWSLTNLAEFQFLKSQCPLCNSHFLVKLNNSETGVRCISCQAGVVQMSIIMAVQKYAKDLNSLDAYELSSGGPVVTFLKENTGSLTLSEYYDDVNPGEIKGGVLCQDVQALTFNDNVFDLCTSTEVFEHVPDDMRGFQEIFRILKKQGVMIFTVPINLAGVTLQRAIIENNELVHLEEPEYHDDAIRGQGKVLAYRTYGTDIVAQLKTAGFESAVIDQTFRDQLFGHGRAIIVAFAGEKSG